MKSFSELVRSSGVDSQQRLPGFDGVADFLDLINAHGVVDGVCRLCPAAAKTYDHATDDLGVHLANHSAVRC